MHRITRVALACSTILVVASCAKSEQAATDSAAGTMAPPAVTPEPAPAASITLADVAGNWKINTVPESGPDTSLTTSVLHAAAETTGWTSELPSGKKVPLKVATAGDSIMITSDAYSSMRRKGKQVWTESVLRLQDGKLMGVMVAHYVNAGADSVLRLRAEGTRLP